MSGTKMNDYAGTVPTVENKQSVTGHHGVSLAHPVDLHEQFHSSAQDQLVIR